MTECFYGTLVWLESTRQKRRLCFSGHDGGGPLGENWGFHVAGMHGDSHRHLRANRDGSVVVAHFHLGRGMHVGVGDEAEAQEGNRVSGLEVVGQVRQKHHCAFVTDLHRKMEGLAGAGLDDLDHLAGGEEGGPADIGRDLHSNRDSSPPVTVSGFTAEWMK